MNFDLFLPDIMPGNISISVENARKLYTEAGSTLEQFNRSFVNEGEFIVKEEFRGEIREICKKLGISFQLQKFQVDTLAALCQGRSVILAAPTGSGKSVIMDLFCEYMRVKSGVSNGVVICTTPLDSIMQNKAMVGDATRGYITMAGKAVVTEGKEGSKETLEVSVSREQIISGAVKVIMGHHESFTCPDGYSVLPTRQPDLRPAAAGQADH